MHVYYLVKTNPVCKHRFFFNWQSGREQQYQYSTLMFFFFCLYFVLVWISDIVFHINENFYFYLDVQYFQYIHFPLSLTFCEILPNDKLIIYAPHPEGGISKSREFCCFKTVH